jgi:hypothetical protein
VSHVGTISQADHQKNLPDRNDWYQRDFVRVTEPLNTAVAGNC